MDFVYKTLSTRFVGLTQKKQENGMNDLKSFSENRFYSQFGEDGIVVEILERLSKYIELDHWCSEFGAWDGVHLSNTCHLIRKFNYSAVLIEGDKKKVQALKKNFPQKEVEKICRFVNFDGKNSLESIYDETDIPSNFDFLSIDVDGVDYFILESLSHYRPKVICIEFNPSIPNAVDYVQPKDFRIKHGCSAKAIVRLAREKGYVLVATTQCNLVLVDSSFSKYVIEDELEIEVLNPQGNDAVYIFSGYDGTLLSNKEWVDLRWHGIVAPLSKLQFLPKIFRRFYGDFGVCRRLFFLIFVVLKIPGFTWKHKNYAVQRIKDEMRRIGFLL